MKSKKNKFNSSRGLWFLPAIVWAGVIYFFSSQQVLPGLEVSLYDYLLKKGGHMFVYALLYFFLMLGFDKMENEKPRHSWLISLLICLVYALSDEFHQSQVPGRTAAWRDVGYDLLGANLMLLKRFNYI
ncbi:MAG: hypothetical protein GF381_00285 [Candidatus Pacebacteria bacterium]|nr:hypothetical protein [Candidatus Paceibacterota bacterium]